VSLDCGIPPPTPNNYANCENALNASRDYAGSFTTNDDLTAGKITPSPPTGYDPGTRTLTGDASHTVTLAAGIYNVCAITARTIQIPVGAVVQIFIDSKARSATACPTQITEPIDFATGDVTFNGIWAGNATPVASNLQIFVYGVPSGSPQCTMGDGHGGQHTPTVRAALFAPNCDFIFDKTNNAFWRGALVGRNIEFKNSLDFRDDSSGGGITGGSAPFYQRQRWMECKKTAPPSDPESGC
jgi:hypothetical protein